MGAPFSLENTMRRHEEVFSLWLRGLTVDYGNLGGSAKANYPILQTMSSPQRAFADLHKTLVKQGFVTGADAEEQTTAAKLFAVLPLPFASWERGDPTTHPEHEGVPKRFRKQVFDQATQTFVSHPWPAMYQTEFRVTLWCLKRYTEVHMREWIYSQLGLIGTAHTEVWLDVPHADPWGTIKQAMKFTGSTDLSALEGEEDQRYFRFEYSFLLNTIHFRLPTESQPYLDTISPTVSFEADGQGVLYEPDFPGEEFAPAIESGNLFQPYTTPALVTSQWPKAGNAVVGISALAPTGTPANGAYMLELESTTDIVDLVNKPMNLGVSGRGVLMVSFKLLSNATTVLDIFQNDGTHTPGTVPTWTSCDQLTLPATSPWAQASFLSLITEPIFDVSVRGSNAPAVARLAQIKVKRLLPGTDIGVSTGPVVVGLDDVYTWTGLEERPYLVIVELTGAGVGTVVLENDATSPTATESKGADFGGNRGVVFLMQPAETSLALRVTTGLPIAPPVAQRYDGTYANHEL